MTKSLSSLVKIIRYLKDQDVDFSKKLLFFIPVIYLIFPFDFIGDYFPILGQLDDVAVFVLMWPLLRSLLSNHNNDTKTGRSNTKDKKYKDAIDIDKDDYEVK